MVHLAKGKCSWGCQQIIEEIKGSSCVLRVHKLNSKLCCLFACSNEINNSSSTHAYKLNKVIFNALFRHRLESRFATWQQRFNDFQWAFFFLLVIWKQQLAVHNYYNTQVKLVINAFFPLGFYALCNACLHHRGGWVCCLLVARWDSISDPLNQDIWITAHCCRRSMPGMFGELWFEAFMRVSSPFSHGIVLSLMKKFTFV